MKRITFRIPDGLWVQLDVSKPAGVSMNAWMCKLLGDAVLPVVRELPKGTDIPAFMAAHKGGDVDVFDDGIDYAEEWRQ